MHLAIHPTILSLFLVTIVHCSTATAQSWMQVPEIGNTYVNAITEPAGVVDVCTDSSVFRSSNGGISWLASTRRPGSSLLNCLCAHDGFLLKGLGGAGPHAVAWQPQGLPSGPYYYRLEAEGSQVTRKMIFLQ
jgi:hypothetical protein